MALLQIEIVVRTIEIGGHHRDIVGGILNIETFAHF
ncbi:hypothetical protein SDC9_205848 [bioreactor metagenome]|uniref:Uncharacterized protein n=1 Tax=bioreactor metagenome TaxID=1076179 RepID=A0A645J429_9ZZZZ